MSDDPLFCMGVAVGDVAMLEDKMSVNDWVLLLAVDEIPLEVNDWSIEDITPADSEDR